MAFRDTNYGSGVPPSGPSRSGSGSDAFLAPDVSSQRYNELFAKAKAWVATRNDVGLSHVLILSCFYVTVYWSGQLVR